MGEKPKKSPLIIIIMALFSLEISRNLALSLINDVVIARESIFFAGETSAAYN